jgi:DNA-binding LacI/PurR family transcriptional regulator
MADVAKHAGVSTQTVSRVANGLANVEDVTRERVLHAMRVVGYRPNRAARALRTGRFRNIGVTMFNLSSYGNMRTLDSIAVAASRAGYSITLMPVEHPTQRNVSSAFANLLEQAVDGFILVVEAHLIDNAELEIPAGLPVVVIDSLAREDYPVVDNDQVEGARLATQHLLDLGHATVWHVAGPHLSHAATRREESWRATLTAAGRAVPPVLRGDWSTASGYEVGLDLAEQSDVTAVFAGNDQMALGVMQALHERGRQVPDDVSIVGYDDLAEAGYFWPPLTTIHQHFESVGQRSIEILIDEVENGRVTPMLSIVPVRLVVRGSTAPYSAR